MTIVILDASQTVRQKIETLVLETEYHDLDVVSFSDGNEVLDYMTMNEVDILFSSIEMEGIDGVSFIDLLLRKYPFMAAKLFIVTSQNNSESMKEIKAIGAKRFIRKPIKEEYFKHFIYPEMHKVLF